MDDNLPHTPGSYAAEYKGLQNRLLPAIIFSAVAASVCDIATVALPNSLSFSATVLFGIHCAACLVLYAKIASWQSKFRAVGVGIEWGSEIEEQRSQRYNLMVRRLTLDL